MLLLSLVNRSLHEIRVKAAAAAAADLLIADRDSSGERRHIQACSLISCHSCAAAGPATASRLFQSSRLAAVACTPVTFREWEQI